MKKVLTLVTIMAVTLAFAGVAFAADGPVTATGKIEVKDKVSSLKVAEAKGADGKAVADLAGKDLKCTGAKAADCAKLAGKEVEAKGTVKGAEIDVTAIAEKVPAKK
ncbi:MAG: hypothetical protein NTU83_07070 [Candidatus Hydrogenedentes bacterium]|nr:hypothetical protein [Candidatus Hydrogenedentota bacterium]